MQAPVMILSKSLGYALFVFYYLLDLDSNTKRETGKVAQLGNIAAAKVSII